MTLYSLFQKYNFHLNSKEVELSSWVEVDSVLIKRNCVIHTGLEIDDSPKFGIVQDIILVDKSIILLGCRKIENLGFDRHFYAYSALESDELFLFSVENVQAVSYMFQGGQNKKFVCLN